MSYDQNSVVGEIITFSDSSSYVYTLVLGCVFPCKNRWHDSEDSCSCRAYNTKYIVQSTLDNFKFANSPIWLLIFIALKLCCQNISELPENIMPISSQADYNSLLWPKELKCYLCPLKYQFKVILLRGDFKQIQAPVS